jgi:hypothetical protein
MERRRPNRDLKNSEDVQDALIEDYFRYDDLSRMEADDILMNISESDSDLGVIGRTGMGANTENIRIGLVFVVLAQ